MKVYFRTDGAYWLKRVRKSNKCTSDKVPNHHINKDNQQTSSCNGLICTRGKSETTSKYLG